MASNSSTCTQRRGRRSAGAPRRRARPRELRASAGAPFRTRPGTRRAPSCGPAPPQCCAWARPSAGGWRTCARGGRARAVRSRRRRTKRRPAGAWGTAEPRHGGEGGRGRADRCGGRQRGATVGRVPEEPGSAAAVRGGGAWRRAQLAASADWQAPQGLDVFPEPGFVAKSRTEEGKKARLPIAAPLCACKNAPRAPQVMLNVCKAAAIGMPEELDGCFAPPLPPHLLAALPACLRPHRDARRPRRFPAPSHPAQLHRPSQGDGSR